MLLHDAVNGMFCTSMGTANAIQQLDPGHRIMHHGPDQLSARACVAGDQGPI